MSLKGTLLGTLGVTLGLLIPVGGFIDTPPGGNVVVAQADSVDSGTIGDGCHWEWDSQRNLFLSGGTLPEYQGEWNTYFDIPASPIMAAIAAQTGRSIESVGSNPLRIIFTGPVKAGKDARGLLGGFRHLEGIDGMENLDTSETKNMSYLFARDYNTFNFPDMRSFNTDSATDMSYMFWDSVSDPNTVHLENFNTENVTNMEGMFKAFALDNEGTDISNLKTDKVTNMKEMFAQAGLQEGNLTHLNTSQVTNMEGMFRQVNVSDQDLSHFDTRNVTNMKDMFANGYSTKVDVGHFKTDQVTTMANMFAGNPELTDIDVSGFNTSQVTDMSHLFDGNEALTEVDLSNFDTRQADTTAMLSGVIGLERLGLGSQVQFATDQDPQLTEITADPEKYTGKWQATSGGTAYTSQELTQRYGTAGQPSATYVWQPVGQPTPPDSSGDGSSGGGTTGGNTGGGTGEIPVTPPTTPTNPITPPATDTDEPDQPTTVQRQARTVVKKLALYQTPTFTQQSRKFYYTKQARTRRPQLVVTGIAYSQAGRLRYRVQDVTPNSPYKGQTGYVTAKAGFTVQTYYQHAPRRVKLLTAVNAYRDKALKQRVKHLKRGQVVRIQKIVRHNLTTRLVLTDGSYITGNKAHVLAK